MTRENPPLITDADIVALLAMWTPEQMDDIAAKLRENATEDAHFDMACWVEDCAWHSRRYLASMAAHPGAGPALRLVASG